jgi:phosphomannomutase
VDGVKIALNHEEWVLVLPNPDQPHLHVIVEATSQVTADRYLQEYVRLVENLQPENS